MKVKIKNFMSIKEGEIEFKNSSIIIGENLDEGGSNGSGKSAIIEAILFGLYGRVLRGSLKEVIRKGEKVAIVEVQTDKFSIYRSISLSSVNEAKLNVDGKKIVGVNNVNQAIVELLGSFDEFILANYFSDVHRFSKLTETQRKEVLTRFVSLDLVERMLEKVKEREREFSVESARLEVKQASLEKQIKEYNEKLEEINKELKEVKEEKLDRKKIDEYYAIKREIDELRYKYQGISENVKRLEKEKRSLQKGVCPLCLRPFIKEDDLKKLREKYEKEEECLRSELERTNNRLKELSDEFSKKFKDFNVDEYVKKLEASASRKELIKIKKDLEKDIKYKTDELEKVKKDKEKVLELLDLCKYLKAKLGWKGVKSMLIESFLGAFEERLNDYLNEAGLSFSAQFSVVPSEKGVERLCVSVVDLGGERSLDLLSQGEKRKFDICFMLALNDFLTDKVKFEYMFLDEALDGLDISSIYKIVDFLKEYRKFILISHLPLEFKMPVIKVVKERGLSVIYNEKGGE